MTDSMNTRDFRVLVVSPIDGGSYPIARHVFEAFEELVDVRFADFSTLLQPGHSQDLADIEHRRLAVDYASELLVAQAKAFRPDLCFVLAQAPVNERALACLKDMGVTTAFWFVENYRLTRYWTWLAPLYDWFFTVQKGRFHQELAAVGCHQAHWLPLACHPRRHQSVRLSESERRRYGAELCFAGYGYYNRREFLSGLADQNLKIWGPGFKRSPVERFVQNDGLAFSESEWARIASAGDIHINLHSASHVPGVDPEGDYLNPRVFELASFGAFQLCDYRSQLTQLFDSPDEVPCFRDLKELRALIEKYRDHPERRREIGANAQRTVRTLHTYRNRIETVLSLISSSSMTGDSGARVRATAAEPSQSERAARRSAESDQLTELWQEFETKPTLNDAEALFRIAMYPANNPKRAYAQTVESKP